MLPTNLENHPEGGKFKEVFRSIHKITCPSLGKRSALTHIYFQLKKGEVSAFHKVSSEEVWNLYQGQGLRLYQWDGYSNSIEIIELSSESMQFCHVVPAHHWQAAEPLGGKVLVGCSVAPGFEFEDFILLHDCIEHAKLFKNAHPKLEHLV